MLNQNGFILKVLQSSHTAIQGTCAGMILLSNAAHHGKTGGQPLLGGLDVVVDRNHFGSQSQSFEAELHTSLPGARLLIGAALIKIDLKSKNMTVKHKSMIQADSSSFWQSIKFNYLLQAALCTAYSSGHQPSLHTGLAWRCCQH